MLVRPLQLRGKQADPIEGEFCLVKSKNYQAFLAAIGKVDFVKASFICFVIICVVFKVHANIKFKLMSLLALFLLSFIISVPIYVYILVVICRCSPFLCHCICRDHFCPSQVVWF